MANKIDDILISYEQPDFEKRLRSFLGNISINKSLRSEIHLEQIAKIVDSVQDKGDKAIVDFTQKYDDVKLSPSDFLISQVELEKAHRQVDENILLSIRGSIENVRKYQQEIFIGSNNHPGIKYTPVKRVGICVPGASAPLPSTVIMCAVPAQVAGVKEIAVVSPPRYEKSIHPVILATCYELGIKEVYRIGGAQAVAGLAFGTDTLKKVDKIVGPGNVWVQTAKKIVFGTVGIDSCAGQSEVLIIANDQAEPSWVAADMLSQAEHAPGSALLFTDSEKLAKQVLEQLKEQLKQLSRSEKTAECLAMFSGIAVFNTIDDAVESANDFAPEHLQIQCGDKSRKVADRITNAGAIFIGDYTPVAVGDYWAGPSHTLPTGQTAKFFSALTSNDFIKSISIIEYDKNKLLENAEDIIRLAQTEGLDAHAKSVEIRLK